MKKILLPVVLTSFIFANDNYVELVGGYLDEKDNFSINSNEKISSLGSAKSEKSGTAFLNFYYGFSLANDYKIYISSNYSEFRLGNQISFDNSFLNIGIKGDYLGEAWQNPYLTKSKRKKTDTKEYGAYLEYTILPTQDLETMFKYEYTQKKYDKDELKGDLKRDAKNHYIGIENTFFSNNSSYIADLHFEQNQAEGKANSFDKYEIEGGISSQISDNLRLTILANYGNKNYKKHNSAVNKKVKVKLYGTNAILNWDKPLGYKNFYTYTNVGYQKEEANVDFFDKEATYTLIGLGYKF